MQPRLLDAAEFSAQNRKRLIWSNLPFGPFEKVNVVLQDILQPHREALVKKVYTITTSMNSLRQGLYK